MSFSALLYIPLRTRINFIRGISQSLPIRYGSNLRGISRGIVNFRWSTNFHEWSRRRNTSDPEFDVSRSLKERGIKRRLIVREAEIKCPDNGRRFTSLYDTEADNRVEGNQIWPIPPDPRGSIRGRRGIPSIRERPARPSAISYLCTWTHVEVSPLWVSNKLAGWAVAHCLEQIDRLITHPQKNNSR